MSPSVAVAVAISVPIGIAVGIFFAVTRRATRDIRSTHDILKLRWFQFRHGLFALVIIGFIAATLLCGAFRALTTDEQPLPPAPTLPTRR